MHLHVGRQLDHRIAVPESGRRGPVACHHIHKASRRTDGRTTRGPDPRFPRNRCPIPRNRSSGFRHRHHVAVVVAAVAVQPTERDVNASGRESESPTLLLHHRDRSRKIDDQLPQHRTIGEAQREQSVVVSAQERHHVQAAGRGVCHWSTSDSAEGCDVAARKRRGVDRITQVLLPHYSARKQVEGIYRVVLGRHHHVTRHDQRRGVHVSVH